MQKLNYAKYFNIFSMTSQIYNKKVKQIDLVFTLKMLLILSYFDFTSSTKNKLQLKITEMPICMGLIIIR